MDPYLNQQDASMRLHQTVCLYKGEPVFVQFNEEGSATKVTISYFDESKRRPKTIHYTDPEFTYEPIRLGYMNTKGNTYFLSRSPVRRQKQGLTYNSISVSPKKSVFFSFPCLPLMKTIIGDYPTLKQAFKWMDEGKVEGVAVDRDVAFRRNDVDMYDILFKERTVGRYSLVTNQINWESTEMTSIIFRILESKGLGALSHSGY